MPKMCDTAICSGCAACALACPKGCITMTADREGFLRPFVDETKCVNCGLCQKACPVLHPPILPETQPTCFAAFNENDRDRYAASSGGVFILLARWVISRGGVVFGAALGSDMTLSHRWTETEAGVMSFCGSKYLQSDVKNTYREAGIFLEQGRYVLYSGTPCQIRGLKSHLNKNYDKLITVDIICHGVPSPAVWQLYVQERAQKDAGGMLPKQVSFRDKSQGWSAFSMRFVYEQTEYCVVHKQDPYMRGFLRDLYLRPSCYQCTAKGMRRISDLTLADYWGVQKFSPDMDDDKGTSLVFCHTEKARILWEDIANRTRWKQIDPEIGARPNPAMVRSPKAHPNRAAFFSRFEQEQLEDLVMELTPDLVSPPPSLRQRIRAFVGRVLRKSGLRR